MNKRLLVGISVLVVAIFLGLFVLGGSQTNQTPGTFPSQPTQAQSQQLPETVTITVDSSGFTPSVITIKTGIRIVWANKTDSDISINSDEHPTHRLFRELNLGHLPSESNVSLVFNKQGTYTYHDHYNPSRTGTVVVE